jgi:hypothetical protein
LIREDRLAVEHHVQYARPGEAHHRSEVQLVLDFPLEAPGPQKKVDSGKTAFDLDGQDSRLSVLQRNGCSRYMR